MRGIVTVKKVFDDGTEELVAYDDNVITVGLSESFVNLFSNNISDDPSNLLAGYFQVGSGAHSVPEDPTLKTHVYSLKDPFLEQHYGPSATQEVDIHDQVYAVGGNFSQNTNTQVFKGTFLSLGDEYSTRVGDDSVFYRLNIGKTTGNGRLIQEFGLFSRNPSAHRVERSSMIAYKALDTAIIKSELFSLVIDWQIRFIDTVQEIQGVQTHEGLGTGFNVVLIMADDFGVDECGIYDSINPYDLSCPSNANANPFSPLDSADGCGIYPHTPTLSAMAAGGITFFNARANTMSSPTRANILTGKCAFSSPGFMWNAGEATEYKGLWGHGIATVFTQDFQKLRGGLKGLGEVYPFKNNDQHNPFGVPVGSPITLEFAQTGGSKLDSAEDKGGWPSSWISNSIGGVAGANHVLGYIPGNFTILPSLIRNTDYVPSGYQSAMVGKWHLTEWDQLRVYDEGDLEAYGNGWKHIHNVGQWDYARAMFANLDKIPVPGHSGDTPNLASYRGWEVVQSSYDLSDADMGYINYFQYLYDGYGGAAGTTSSILTVSDTGYTTFDQIAAGSPFVQGAVSSYATNKSFSDASSLFNSMEEPFFLYLPLNAPHAPYTYPPSSTVYTSYYNTSNIAKLMEDGQTASEAASAIWVNSNAMIENMDWALSAFLSSIDSARKDRTIFIFQGDNGTPQVKMEKLYEFASSLGTLSGIGSGYAPLVYPSLFADTSGGRGGPQGTDGRFKSSCYDRGVIIPYIVSASFLGGLGLGGTSSMAFVDVVDDYNTIAHVAGVDYNFVPQTQKTHTDGGSILPILRGEVDASSHVRQFSFFETVKPIGSTTGNMNVSSGTWSGEVGKYAPVSGDSGPPEYDPYPWDSGNFFGASSAPDVCGTGVGWVPYERRRGYMKRSSKTTMGWQYMFETWPFSECTPFEAGNNQQECEDNGGTWTQGVTCVYGDILEASAGVWKLIQPSEGSTYDELYHMKDYNFEDVDPFELNNLLEGFQGSVIIPQLMDLADVTDPTDHYWSLARIYGHVQMSFLDYLQYRTIDMTAVNSMYGGFPDAASNLQMPSISDTDTHI